MQSVDPRLDRIVARALERDPARRFPTALAMREALEDYIAASGLPSRHEDIGRLVCELFKDTRANVQGQIRERLREEASASQSRLKTPKLLLLVDQTMPATPRAIRRVSAPKVTVKSRARSAGRVLVATLGILASVAYVRHVASNQSLPQGAVVASSPVEPAVESAIPSAEAAIEPPSPAPSVANEDPSAAPSTRSEVTSTVPAPSLGAARRSVSLEHHRSRRPGR
jgi:hypothetical protein